MTVQVPWYADLVNYLAYGVMPLELTYPHKMKLRTYARFYIWDDLFLFRREAYHIIKRCVPEVKQVEILDKCHASQHGDHFAGDKTAQKILQSRFYWPTLFRDSSEWGLNSVINVREWAT